MITLDKEQFPGRAVWVTLAGQEITGLILSFTVTVCVQVDLFPQTSVAVQVTTLTPEGN